MLDTRGKILSFFREQFPDLVEALIACDHGHPSGLNPWHLEGSVYSHTLMVANGTHTLSGFWSGLLHDIGKIETRKVVESEERGVRVRFLGHEGVSFFRSLPVLKSAGLGPKAIQQIMTAIAVHGSFRDSSFQDFMEKTSGFDDETLSLIIELLQADASGRVSLTDKSWDYPDIEDILSCRYDRPWEALQQDKELLLLVGLPGAGKSTFVKDNNLSETHRIISRDDLIEKLGKGRDYPDKREYFIRNKRENVKLQKAFKEEVIAAKASGENVVVDLTSLVKRDRASFVDFAKAGYRIKAVIFAADIETCVSRNSNRKGKALDSGVISHLAHRFHFPLFDEVHEIQWIFPE